MPGSCIISFSKVSQTSTIASHKIALFLSTFLSYPIFDSVNNIHKAGEYDRWLIVNLPFSFCKFQDAYIDLIQRNPDLKMVWVQNDYTIPIRMYRKYLKDPAKQCSVWSNMPYYTKGINDHYINWNMLAYKPVKMRPCKKEGIFYWGAFRKGRINAFKKFFQYGDYHIHISTASSQSAKKFMYLCHQRGRDLNTIHFYNPIKNLIHGISLFQATVYMEDEWSSVNYNSPANRFYEALSAGLPILFDKTSEGTMIQAGYDVSKYVVNNSDDVESLLSNSVDIALQQRSEWMKDYIQELKDEVRKADGR